VVADIFRRHPHVGLVYHEFDIVDGYGASLRKPTPEPTWTGYTIPLDRVPSQLQSLILLGHPWSCVLCGLAVRRSLLTTLRIPEEVAKYHADLFLYLVLPFMTAVEVVATSHAAYVHHGANAELFRSSRESRESQARELAYARRYVEEHFGVRFLTYLGRGMYGDDCAVSMRGFARLAVAGREARQIAAAEVEPAIKRVAGLKLAASLFLPGRSYDFARSLWSYARQR
jgi:hypothetical protein